MRRILLPIFLAFLLVASAPAQVKVSGGVGGKGGVAIRTAPLLGFYRTVTIDHTKVPSANQSNFPVLVAGTYSYLATVANGGKVQNANGYDIVFYSDVGLTSKLAFENELYVATTGQVVYWVKVPTVSTSVDTVIYMAYGNAAITTDQSDKVNVWDSNYKLVAHLPNGATLTANDSTSNANNGTLQATPTAATGQIDGAGSFASASSQYVDFGQGASLYPTAITISTWAKATTLTNGYSALVSSVQGNSQYYQLFVKSTGKIAVYVKATADVDYDGSGSNTLSTGTWYYVAVTYDSSAGLVGYINASSDQTVAANGNLATGFIPTVTIANDAGTAGRFWNGVIDEVRISSIARSANWITTEYNNQSSPSTFYSLGNETPR